MAVKSIVDIDIDPNGKFRAFNKLFNDYQKALKSQPAAWALVNQKIDGTKTSFDKVVDKMVAANVQAKLMEKAQERANQLTRTSAERWASMARSARDFASGLRDSLSSVIRISALTGIVGGIAGAGGLFGIDRLAHGVAGSRQSAFGLGASYGGQRAFGTNFSRFVGSPDSFLGSIAQAKGDVTQRIGLISAGLSQQEIGGDTAETAVALLRRYKNIADTTDPGLYQQRIDSFRLPGASVEMFNKLRATSSAEFNQQLSSYGRDRSSFGQSGDVTQRWQDFVTQMERAGQKIEAVFVRGLDPLIPGLTKLSDSVAEAIKTLLSSKNLKTFLTDFGSGIETFAKYIGGEKFQGDVRTFADNISVLTAATSRIAGWIAPSDKQEAAQKLFGSLNPSFIEGIRTGAGASPVNNPGNLRPPNQLTGFAQYPTQEAGVRAMARQILLYGTRDHLDTVAGLVGKYAPPSENNTAAYVADVSRKTGFGAGDRLNLGDPDVLAKLLAAMISHEQKPGSYDRYKDAKIVVEIIKPTGSDTAVTVNGVKGN